MTQPEALRLADWLDHHGDKISHGDAAAELRRLYGLTQELLAELYVYRASKHLKDVTAAYKKMAEAK